MLRAVGARLPERPKALARRLLGERYHRLFPGWHREVVGGLWEEVGVLQRDFLVARGLEPGHDLLDIGCGSLRAGVPLIGFLDPGRYHGIDASMELLAAGRVEIARSGVGHKAPRLRHDANFGLEAFGTTFDYAIAHSLFTHLPINSMLVCLLNVARVLRRPGGCFFATFYENPRGTKRLDVLEHPRVDRAPIRTRPDGNPYHYGLDLFEWLVDGIGLRVELVGDWGSPRPQRMLLFTPDGVT
jgi:SAM-dependent methyltransferase